MTKPELLSPAGSMEKLRSALHFGADAVYLGLERFSMRAAADNFGMAALAQACAYARARGRRVYLALNAAVAEGDEGELREIMQGIRALDERPDAVICSDVGLVALVRRELPGMSVHISTQANTRSALTCRAWFDMGASRVILSRELSLEQIKRIRGGTPPELELECFVHGAMCVAWSGRCLLSNYLAGRDAGEGACAQPCRWNYALTEEKRPGEYLPVYEDGGKTAILSSRDLCMIGHVGELVRAGVDSFKIEGRMKSVYYVSAVTNAYRIALDSYIASPEGWAITPALLAEVNSVSHREYDTGYFFSMPHADAKICNDPEYIREGAFLGIAAGYDAERGLAKFIQRGKVDRGQEVQILQPGGTGVDLRADVLLDADGAPIACAKRPMMEFYIKTDFAVSEGDILRAR